MSNEPDEIDALINELNASGGSTPRTGESFLQVEALLAQTIERRGSDLLLVAGAPPAARVDGSLVWLSSTVLDGVDVEEAVFPLLPSHAKRQFSDAGIADGSLRLPRLGRFRINLHRERGRAAAAIRLLPTRVPRLADLGLPPEVAQLSQLNRGLVLVGGATGSGKTWRRSWTRSIGAISGTSSPSRIR